MPGSLVSKRLLCEGWLDEGCEPGDGLVMYPTTGYVEQGTKVWVAFGEHKLDESSGQAVVERFEDLELEERRVGDEVLRLPKGGRWFVEGPFQRSDVENANRRKYPRGIWERLIADSGSYVQKSIKERAMIGHLEHPSDGRTDGAKGAILVTKATLEKDGTVMGQAEILDTPMGLILQEYTKKSVRWGVSSRGNGSVKDDGTVDENNYVLETWDAVMKPSVPGAYPKPRVAEGTSESLDEMKAGDRVQIPAHSDHWMRGDRYGEVVKVSGDRVQVKLDKSGKTVKFAADDVQLVEGEVTEGWDNRAIAAAMSAPLEVSDAVFKKVVLTLDDVPELAAKQYTLLKNGDRYVLVNTEGHDYARYKTPVFGKDSLDLTPAVLGNTFERKGTREKTIPVLSKEQMTSVAAGERGYYEAIDVASNLAEVAIGDTVVVKLPKGRTADSVGGAFVGKRGRVVDMEKDGSAKMWRIEFDEPVKVPGVGDVEDDLFHSTWLRKLREGALAEDSGDVPLYFNAYDYVTRTGKQVPGKQTFLSNDVASALETHLSDALEVVRPKITKMVRAETLKRIRGDATLVGALKNLGFAIVEALAEAKETAEAAYKKHRAALDGFLAEFQRKLKKHAADFAASGSRNYGFVGDVADWSKTVKESLLGQEESQEHPSVASVTEGLEGDAKEYGLAVSALVETDLEGIETGARAKLHRQLLDAMGRGSTLADAGHLSDQMYRQLQGWLTSKLSESMGTDVADLGDAIDDAIRQATVDETADRRDGFARVTTSLKNRLRDALTEAQSYRERLEAAESRATAADGQFRVAVEQLAEAESRIADLDRRLGLAEGLLATRPAAEPSGAVVSAVDEAVRSVPALDEFRSLLERSGSSGEVQRLAEALLPRVVEVREIPEVPRPTGLVAGRPTLPHGRVKSSDAPSRVSESTDAPRGAKVAAGAVRLLETKQ